MTILGKANVTPVTEKYIGDDFKEFRIIEREMAELIKIMERDFLTLHERIATDDMQIFNRKGPDELNKSRHTKEIEKQFKKFFGLKDFRLVWIQTGRPNAVTPVRFFTFMDKNVTADGRFHNDKITVSMMFDVNLVTYMDLNERETIAVMLHEVGHNFYNSIFRTIAKLPLNLYEVIKAPEGILGHAETQKYILTALGTMTIFDFLKISDKIAESREKFDAFLQKHAAPVMNIYRLFNELMYNGTGFLNLKKIQKNPIELIRSLPRLLYRLASTDLIFGYHDERFADNFVADHGYAEDLASALVKFTQNKKNISVMATDQVPGLNWISDFIRLQASFLNLFLDEHPRTITRVRTGLDRLKQNAKDPNLDPRTRKDLEKEIAEYEKFYSDYLSLSKNNNKTRIFSWLYNVIVDKLFGGIGDLREITWRVLDSKSNI